MPKPAKFEKNLPNGYRVIRKTKCGAAGAWRSPIHKQALSKLNFYKLIPYPMDTQGPTDRPRYQFTRGLIGLDNEKRCYDVTLSRQEVRHAT